MTLKRLFVIGTMPVWLPLFVLVLATFIVLLVLLDPQETK